MGGAYSSPSGYTSRRRARRWPWVVFAIGIALGLAVEGLVVVGIYNTVRQVGKATCLPSDFPTYQGASLAGLHVYTGTDGSSCDMVFNSEDSASQVTDFYTTRLDQGDWQTDAVSQADGTVTFERRGNSGVHGTLRILGRGVHSTFEVVLQSGR